MMNEETMDGNRNAEPAVSAPKAETSIPPVSPEQEMINQRNLTRKEEQEALKQGNEGQEICVKAVGEQFGYHELLGLVHGITCSLYLHRNTLGTLMPVFTTIGCGMAYLVLKRMNIPIEKWSYYLAASLLPVSISTCRTANCFFIFFSKQAVLLLWWTFWLRQFYEDDAWNIERYFYTIFQFLFQIVCALGYPFKHCASYVKSLKSRKSRNVVLVLFGVIVAIPLVSILMILPSEVDMVFQSILATLLDMFLKPSMMIGVVAKTLFSVVTFYYIICKVSRKGICGGVGDRREQEPIVAITAMGLVGVLHVMFYGVQIMYLSMEREVLSDGMIYSEYVRQGLFQLVFVPLLNLVLVLLCLRYFKKNRILNVVLTIINLYTYVMMASAGHRMMLYISRYYPTLLRILALWFLAVLVVLMAGVPMIIYRNDSPLFRYRVAVISTVYPTLTWSEPGFIITRYSISREVELSYDSVYYLTHLSADAAPEILKLIGNRWNEYGNVQNYLAWSHKEMSWRTYSFPYAKAKQYR